MEEEWNADSIKQEIVIEETLWEPLNDEENPSQQFVESECCRSNNESGSAEFETWEEALNVQPDGIVCSPYDSVCKIEIKSEPLDQNEEFLEKTWQCEPDDTGREPHSQSMEEDTWGVEEVITADISQSWPVLDIKHETFHTQHGDMMMEEKVCTLQPWPFVNCGPLDPLADHSQSFEKLAALDPKLRRPCSVLLDPTEVTRYFTSKQYHKKKSSSTRKSSSQPPINKQQSKLKTTKTTTSRTSKSAKCNSSQSRKSKTKSSFDNSETPNINIDNNVRDFVMKEKIIRYRKSGVRLKTHKRITTNKSETSKPVEQTIKKGPKQTKNKVKEDKTEKKVEKDYLPCHLIDHDYFNDIPKISVKTYFEFFYSCPYCIKFVCNIKDLKYHVETYHSNKCNIDCDNAIETPILLFYCKKCKQISDLKTHKHTRVLQSPTKPGKKILTNSRSRQSPQKQQIPVLPKNTEPVKNPVLPKNTQPQNIQYIKINIKNTKTNNKMQRRKKLPSKVNDSINLSELVNAPMYIAENIFVTDSINLPDSIEYIDSEPIDIRSKMLVERGLTPDVDCINVKFKETETKDQKRQNEIKQHDETIKCTIVHMVENIFGTPKREEQLKTLEHNFHGIKGDIIKSHIPVGSSDILTDEYSLLIQNSFKRIDNSECLNSISHGCICTICNRRFLTFHQLIKHAKSHLIITYFIYVCENCFQYFKTEYYLIKHTESVHKQSMSLTFTNRTKKIKGFKCKHCSLIFSDSKLFYTHCFTHSTDDYLPLLCSICNQLFNNKVELKKHCCYVHNVNVVLFKCQLCFQRFRDTRNLIEHVNTAHSISMIHCNNCKTNMFSEYYMQSHIKHCFKNILEKKMDTLSCPLCLKCLSYDNMILHLEIHIKNLSNRYICKFCLNYFYTKTNIDEHLKYHHNIFQCDKCQSEFTLKKSFDFHDCVYTSS